MEVVFLAIVISIGACLLAVILHRFPIVLTFRYERRDGGLDAAAEFMEAQEAERDKQKKQREEALRERYGQS